MKTIRFGRDAHPDNAPEFDPDHLIRCDVPVRRSDLKYRVPKFRVPTGVSIFLDILLAVATIILYVSITSLVVMVLTGAITGVVSGTHSAEEGVSALQFSTAAAGAITAAMLIMYPKFHKAIRGLIIRAATVEVDPIGDYLKKHTTKPDNAGQDTNEVENDD